MNGHPGAQRAREYIDVFHRGDFHALRNFYDENVVWHLAGHHPMAGDYRGREALFSYFDRVRDMTGGSLRLEPESILASDRYTAMFTRVTGRRDGRTLDVVLAQVFRVGDDGRWIEYWGLADDQDAVDEFWF
jgi:hypothetical protein